jgi:hypothetical protein
MKEKKAMKRITLTAITFGMMAIITMAISQSTITAQQSTVDPVKFGIEGTWDTQVTFVDCTTGVPLFPPGNSLVSYNQGGTYIEEASGTPPSRRYPGLGVWQHVRARTYALAFKVFQYNADGTSNGRIVVNAEVEHNLDDTLTNTAVARFYSATGDLIVSRCVNSVGTRFTGKIDLASVDGRNGGRLAPLTTADEL